MSDVASFVFNIELSLGVSVVAAFVLSFLLFLINVPASEHSRKILKTKNTIAMCFLVCSVLFYTCLKHSGTDDYEVFSSLMMFVVTAISSSILSFSLMNLLEESDNDKFYLNIAAVIVMSCIMVKSFWMEKEWLRILIITSSVLLFVVNCVVHIVIFHRTYVRSIRKLEQYYDEDEDSKMKWIRFCYIIMMLTQMFILVYLVLPRGFMKIYIIWYVLFMLYFSANFISFLGSHRLLLDAFAHKTLSGEEIKMRIERRRKEKKGYQEKSMPDADAGEAELRRIGRAVEQWVKDRKYREHDRTRDQIAREMNTTKDMLHLYFVMKVGMDFKTWRTNLRIEDAKKLLLENKEMSINIVAELSGFSDRSNFHRQFTKIVGCSPKQWRESGGTPLE